MKFIKRFNLILFFVAVVYLLWELYWYKKLGYRFVKWHTHIMAYAYLYLFVSGVFWVFNIINLSLNYSFLRTILISTTLTLIAVESVLILFGIGDTYFELIGQGYSSVYDTRYETYYRLHKSHEEYCIIRPEFKHLRVCNSLGFSDEDWQTERTSKKRILLLGDSFTEGVGAVQDSNYVSILRTLIDTSRVELMNAGIAGNDPVVSYVTYRDILSKFNPDIIVQSFSSNDMHTDIAVKGGLERFKNDSTIIFSSRPWWEPIYAVSYVSRLFFNAAGYNDLLIKQPLTTDFQKTLNEKAKVMFRQYVELAKKNNTDFLLVLQPYTGEVSNKQYDYDLVPIIEEIKDNKNVYVFDLLPYYTAYYEKSRENIDDFYWTQDRHCNAKGYALMAEGVKHALDSFKLTQ